MTDNNFKYIDAHSHLHDKAFDSDRKDLIQEMRKSGIATVAIGTDLKASQDAQRTADMSDNIYFTIGVHPHDDVTAIFDSGEFEKLASHPKCVAVGECGLDYYYLELEIKKNTNNLSDVELSEKRRAEKNRQKILFKDQIKFALSHNLPLMLHGRPSAKDDIINSNGMDAYIDMLEILNEEKQARAGDNLRGNVHFFVGDIEIAKQFLGLGFTFSLGGVLTITSEYDDVVRYLPIDSMHAETDSPYVSPRGPGGKKVSQRNSPLNIGIIIDKIAEIKNIDREELSNVLHRNFIRDFLQ